MEVSDASCGSERCSRFDSNSALLDYIEVGFLVSAVEQQQGPAVIGLH